MALHVCRAVLINRHRVRVLFLVNSCALSTLSTCYSPTASHPAAMQQPRPDDSDTATPATQPPPPPKSPVSPTFKFSTPFTIPQPSTIQPLFYACAFPAYSGFVLGAFCSLFVKLAVRDVDLLKTVVRMGVGLGTLRTVQCMRVKARGGSKRDDPRLYYDRAIAFGIGSTTVALTGKLWDVLRGTERTLPPRLMLKWTLAYGLTGVLVGGTLVGRHTRLAVRL